MGRCCPPAWRFSDRWGEGHIFCSEQCQGLYHLALNRVEKGEYIATVQMLPNQTAEVHCYKQAKKKPAYFNQHIETTSCPAHYLIYQPLAPDTRVGLTVLAPGWRPGKAGFICPEHAGDDK